MALAGELNPLRAQVPAEVVLAPLLNEFLVLVDMLVVGVLLPNLRDGPPCRRLALLFEGKIGLVRY